MSIVPNLGKKFSKMWLKVLNLEKSLFPELKEQLGILSSKEEKLIKILDFAEIEKQVTVCTITNPPKDREEIARAFIAKSVYNIQTTRDLIARLHRDKTLRIICGWRYAKDLPSETKFSRVFKEFSEIKLAQKAHEYFISEYLAGEIFLYNASDSTKIELREKPVKVQKQQKLKSKRGRPRRNEVRPPKEPTILEQQSQMKTVEEMLTLVSTHCSVGTKKNSKGNHEYWIGGKFHISAIDGDIPIAAIYSGANIHDSSVALPLMLTATKRVSYLFDLQDAGYDAKIIRDTSFQLGHKPIIDINPKRSKELKMQIALDKEEKKKLDWLNLPYSSDNHHYKARSMVERVNKYLKEDFGCNTIYYQGATKVASVLAFGILSVCIHQSLKLIT